MKILVLFGLFLIVKISYQRSIIPLLILSENNEQHIYDAPAATHMNKFGSNNNNNEKIINGNENTIEKYVQSRKLLEKQKNEREKREIEIPDINIPEIKIPEIPEVKIPDIKIPDIPEIKIDPFQISDKNEKKKRHAESDVGPFKIIAKEMYNKNADAKNDIDEKFLNSIEKILKNQKHQKSSNDGNIHIIEYKGDTDDEIDPNKIIYKVTYKFGDKHIRLYHIQSYDILEDTVVEFGGDIYIDKNLPQKIADIFVVKVL